MEFISLQIKVIINANKVIPERLVVVIHSSIKELCNHEH